MKVAFLIESFLPFGGGSEWSSFYLAKDLAKKGIDVVILTPNLGSKTREKSGKVRIVRFPFYLKLKNKKGLPGNFAYTNPLWIIWASVYYFIFLKQEKPDVIHVQGKYSIIGAKVANLFLNVPLVSTIRDYQLICNYGFCLYERNRACSLFEYFTHDFVYYFNNYLRSQDLVTVLLNVLYAIWGRFARNLMRAFAQDSDIVVLSKKQRDIFLANGFDKVTVIGNSFTFPKKLAKVEKQNFILFAGRLTLGKGVGILTEILPNFFKSFPKYLFYFVGEGPLEKNVAFLKKTNQNLMILGQIEHKQLLFLISKARLVVMPSLWPEPFGRIALEAISQGTPVVATRRGGLPEIVKDGRYGKVVNPTPGEIMGAIKKVIENTKKYQSNIQEDFPNIKRKFQYEISNSYIHYYQKLIK